MFNTLLLSAILFLSSLSEASNAFAFTPLNSHLESLKETFVTSGKAKLFCTGQGQAFLVPASSERYALFVQTYMRRIGPYQEDPTVYFEYIHIFLKVGSK